MEAPKKRRSRKKWIVLGVVLVIVLVLAGVGYTMARRLTGPAVGTIIAGVPDYKKQPDVQLEQFDGKLFSFVHPMTYIEQSTKPQPNDTQLESHTFLSTTMNGGVLVATVSKLPSNNPGDDASYYARTQDPKKYAAKTVVVQNEQVFIFTSNDGQQLQQTAYWPHKGMMLTFSLTGVANDVQSSTSEYLGMVESITWH